MQGPEPTTRGGSFAGGLVIGLLCAASLGLVFQSGAYGATKWLPILAAMATLVFVAVIAGPALSSGRLQKALLGIFAAQAAWTAASVLWATSVANAWEETDRTLLYAVGLALAFAAVRWVGSAGLNALAVLLTTAIGAVALVIVIRLAVAGDPLSLFADARLDYPVTYFNGLAAFLMLGFWLALGLANAARCSPVRYVEEPTSRAEVRMRDRFPRWTQPLFLMLGVLLLETALLTQSRGALWAFFLVVPFYLILSPHRLRALADLVIVVAPVVLFWGTLSGVYAAIRDQASPDAALNSALLAIGYSVAIVLGAWLVTWLVERWIGPLSRRAAVWMGVALIVLAIFGAAGGIVYADHSTGGIDGYLSDRWEEFTADKAPDESASSRFAAVGLNGRLTQWRVAAGAFREEPLLGLGAQNFEYYYYENRTTLMEVRQPHSQPMQLLCELGVPGLVLWLAFVLLVLVRAVVHRFRSTPFTPQVAAAAAMTAVISWFIHSSADWLWQLAGVSLPAILLLGGLIALDTTKTPPLSASAGTPALPDPEDTSLPADAVADDLVPLDVLADDLVPSEEAVDGPPSRPRRSAVLRSLAALLALVVIASAAFPYLSSRFSSMAEGIDDLDTVTSRTHTASVLDPTSVTPFNVRASAHTLAAEQMPVGSPERLEQLQLAAEAWENATEVEPGAWLCHYKAAEAFLAARDAALAADSDSTVQLAARARTHLDEAHRLNPLSAHVKALEEAF